MTRPIYSVPKVVPVTDLVGLKVVVDSDAYRVVAVTPKDMFGVMVLEIDNAWLTLERVKDATDWTTTG